MYILFLIAGLILLYYGANFLVKGSSTIALTFGVKKMVVGLTVVALGTSMPEFVVSLFGALEKVDSVSVGNIVGSNVANILLVLGLAGVFRPFRAEKRIFQIDLPVLLIITILFLLFCRDGLLSGLEAAIMLVFFVIYMTFIIKNRRIADFDRSTLENLESGHVFKNIMLALIGIAGLVVGGNLTVRGGVELARVVGISELTIGLSVIALGTSLPELFTSVVAAVKKEHEISIGNIIGSNLFNTAFVLGIVPIIHPLYIDPKVVRIDNIFMLAITILLSICLYIGKKLTRWESSFFLILYILFILNLRFRFI